ncbi:MAG: hypothetical protein IPG71_10695 [bacterium]|nr:hypothetical protein [bacterium]
MVRVRPSGAGGTFEYYHRIVGDINGDTYDDIISYVTSFVSGTRKYVYWEAKSWIWQKMLFWNGQMMMFRCM